MSERRSLQGDLARLQEHLGAAAVEVDRTLRDAVSAQPLLAVGAAAGLGFLLGGGLTRAAATLLLGAGARLAGAWLDQEFLERAHAQENET
jgi:hypothetical protein